MTRVQAVAHAERYFKIEHLPLAIAREGLTVMAGLCRDLGAPGAPPRIRAP
jgi:hypothetical protein